MAVQETVANRLQLDDVVREAAKALGPEVVRMKHYVGVDTSGDLAVYFRIVLADWAVEPGVFGDIIVSIQSTLFKLVRPYEDWGLGAYISFRSESEQGSNREWA